MISALHQSLSEFSDNFVRLKAKDDELLAVRERFVKKLELLSLQDSALSEKNPLMGISKQIKGTINDSISQWMKQWDTASPMRELSDAFSDRVILLVFGKVNAGKSSFSNFVAGCFDKKLVKYFHLDNGKICYTDEAFVEGVTETTARIQGIELGGKLVLLDSPGLHSVTDENGDKTRLFTDSTDVVLWLTPSTSPGQVQELEDLKDEIERGKPLLPVITRSDFSEESVASGEIVSILKNKDSETRRIQQEDVQGRAGQKLRDETKVRMPLSVSVHCYCKSDGAEQALIDSGLSALLESIAGIIDSAKVYKSRKAQLQIINYLDKNILESVKSHFIPKIEEMKELVDQQQKKIGNLKEQISKDIMLELCELIPDWAEKFKAAKDTAGLSEKIKSHVKSEIEDRLSTAVSDFVAEIEPVIVSLDYSDVGEYADIEVSYKKVKGNAGKAALGVLAGVAGGVLGAIGGPAGAIAGGIIGGGLGNKAGDLFVETEHVIDVVGVSSEEVVTQALMKLEDVMPYIVSESFQHWSEALAQVEGFLNDFETEISTFEHELEKIKESINA